MLPPIISAMTTVGTFLSSTPKDSLLAGRDAHLHHWAIGGLEGSSGDGTELDAQVLCEEHHVRVVSATNNLVRCSRRQHRNEAHRVHVDVLRVLIMTCSWAFAQQQHCPMPLLRRHRQRLRRTPPCFHAAAVLHCVLGQ
eukprot:TRINITY_DN6599_c0_g1_i4.p2 TRINITY_DN6599_c0_g1~~TRINITY_DN6599_c0_g1_i4.p2  ORF type:complete len:139 (+),score=18.36 TRINITY_DN6599_c0_g1_i4:1405-1821(+)